MCIINIHRASLMKFWGLAPLTLWITNWQKLFVLVLNHIIKLCSVQTHFVCSLTHYQSSLDMRSDHYWPANSPLHFWFMLAVLSEHVKSWPVRACVHTCEINCGENFMSVYIYHRLISILSCCDVDIKHDVRRKRPSWELRLPETARQSAWKLPHSTRLST